MYIHTHIYIYIYTDKTSLKADREVGGGGMGVGWGRGLDFISVAGMNRSSGMEDDDALFHQLSDCDTTPPRGTPHSNSYRNSN